MYRQSGIKISQFIDNDLLTGESVFTFVKDSTNYKITYADFLSQLGVTGTIAPLGGISGVEVLDVQGTVNYIRNIEAGAGINVALNVDDGITIEHNFLVDGTGEPILLDPTNSQPTFVSLVAGNGVTLTSINDTIEIEADEINPTNHGLVSMQGNTTDTVIAVAGTPVLVAGTWTAQEQENFTASTAGRLTYTGAITRTFMIDAVVSADTASGNNKVTALYIAKNGAVIAGSKVAVDLSNNVEKAITSFWTVELSTNQYVELFIANDTDGVDILVRQAILRAHQ
jgi:hypothetical protein